MELRRCGNLHYIQAIKGGLVTKVLNVSRGQPKLKFKDITDLNEGFLFDNVKAVRSCIDVMKKGIVKIEPEFWESDAHDGDNQRINNLDDDDDDDDDDFATLTLKQIKESCKTRKRKRSQGFNSSKTKIEDYMEKQPMEEDDPEFTETLSNLRTKLSKNMKSKKKKKCVKDPPISPQEIVLVDESEEILDGQEFSPSSGDSAGQEFSPSSGDSAALVEMNFECPENECFNGPDDFSSRENKDAKITLEGNSNNELNYKRKEIFDFVPLRMMKPSSCDIVISNPDLSSNQSTNFLAIAFEDHSNSDIHDNHLDDDIDIPVSSPKVASHKDFNYRGLEFRDDITLLNDCSKDEYTAGAEVQDKPCSTIEHELKPDGYLVCRSDDSPEYVEKQSFASECDDDNDTPVSPSKVASHKDLDCLGPEFKDDNTSPDECTAGAEVQDKLFSTIDHGLNSDECLVHCSDGSPEYEEKQSFVSVYNDDERIHVSEASDELTSWNEHEGSPKLHGPERLLSTRKAISPSSQEKLCKAMESIDINHKNNLKCKGELPFTKSTDKNGDAVGLKDITRTGVTNKPNKVRVTSKTSRNGSNLKSVSKTSNSSRSATRLGCSTLQNCSKSAIAFSKQQMHDAECLTMKLTKELKSMKDIMDDMLRSEFCLNTSLRYKVNEARMAVKKATKAEEGAKRWLSFMTRDCNRFCKIMNLADSSSSTPQDVVSPPQDAKRKEKKIAFADEAGGRLCQVRFYDEEGEGQLSEST
ncbi:uncharacterized protein [Cicer arietinum]|uniref:Uncharacterized protein LOC101497987 n=1 Tax=Cicer arietinum TaxID=3827 RepID=A0A1S2YMY3_CICAR|nr:uncharacterized protein LOC101497987 [Cicer arietinum]